MYRELAYGDELSLGGLIAANHHNAKTFMKRHEGPRPQRASDGHGLARDSEVSEVQRIKCSRIGSLDADANRALAGPAEGEGATSALVEAALHLYESKLDSSFFPLRRATEMQRVYLRAVTEVGAARRRRRLAALLGRTSPQVAPPRAKPIAMGPLCTPEHGYAAFTVPHFEKSMKRAIPDLEDRPVRGR